MSVAVANQSKPATPSAGMSEWFIDTTTKTPFLINDTGRCEGRTRNASIAAQGAGFATDTYVLKSDLQIPSFGVQVGSKIRWVISVSKTAAGVATPAFAVRIGAGSGGAGVIGDTARLTLTGPAQTAAIDTGVYELVFHVRSVSATGVVQGTLLLSHNLAATGFANNASSIVQGSGAAFNNSALGGQYIGLSINAGASAAWTVTLVHVEADW